MNISDHEREQMISLCTLVSGYSEQYFMKLSDEDLIAEYERQMGEDVSL